MNLQQYKLAWEDFEKWYNTTFWKKWKTHVMLSDVLGMPFEMQLGVYLKYFEENPARGYIYGAVNGMQGWVSIKSWEEIIEQTFKIRNEQLKK